MRFCFRVVRGDQPLELRDLVQRADLRRHVSGALEDVVSVMKRGQSNFPVTNRFALQNDLFQENCSDPF